MEDRKEFKRFIALYWDQEVASSISHPNRIYKIEPSVMDYIGFLQLRSIESLTDEEINHCFGTAGYPLNKERRPEFINTIAFNHMHYDYLRSIGILVPFGKYSIEEILKMGWVKLKR